MRIFSCLYQRAFNFGVFIDGASHVSPKRKKKVHLNLVLALSAGGNEKFFILILSL